MSGGKDSSATLLMLHEQGYEVIGCTLKTWEYGRSCGTKKQIGCCNLDTIEDAREVALHVGAPYMVLDIRQDFGNKVIDYFSDEYFAGRTPNPCILCNTYIKWDLLRKKADELGCDYLATGHYARIRQLDGRYTLLKGVDENKDQTYALWGLSQENLKRTLLPLGDWKKPDVCTFLHERGFDNLSKKSESYEICFIPDKDYRGFLKRRNPALAEKVAGGEFVLEDGTVVGHHQGYPFYTVGQRRGLNLALGYPVYVTEILPKENRVVVGALDALKRDGMVVNRLNWMSQVSLDGYLDAIIKVRYNDVGTRGVIVQEGDDRLKVFFGKGVHGIAPGQAAVCYTEDGHIVVGGWIASSFRQERLFNAPSP